LTTGQISAHFAQIYGASVPQETVSRITDKVIEEMTTWQTRPLNEVFPRKREGPPAAIFIVPREREVPPAIVVKVRDGQVANRPIFPRKREVPPAAIGVSLAGEKDVLGLWAGTGGEGAKFSDERADRPA
jgi:putative transposase